MLLNILMESAILLIAIIAYILNKQLQALKKQLDEVAKLPLTIIHASDKHPGVKVYGDMTLRGNVYGGGGYGVTGGAVYDEKPVEFNEDDIEGLKCRIKEELN